MDKAVSIDIVILSYTKDESLKNLTIQTIETLLNSEDDNDITFNIIVIESNSSMSPFQYPSSRTIYPDESFGFNKYLNIGIRNSRSEFICFCNNDLIFHKNWASEMLREMENNNLIESASTFCPITHTKSGFDETSSPLEGYENLFSGWCFLTRRALFDKIGLFDEKFIFWYADHDFLKTIKKAGIKNYLISSAKVTHINSSTSSKLDAKDFKKLTILPLLYYNYKWGSENYLTYLMKYVYFSICIKFNLV